MQRTTGKIIILAVIVIAIASFFIFDLGQYLALDYLKQQQQHFDSYYQAHRLSTLLCYFVIYVVVTALSFPGATIMTLAAGALFGFWMALVVVSFASSIGATLAFLVSRLLLRDWVQSRLGDKLQAINDGMEKEGAFYLFSLRLVPLIPFFVINLAMGLTPIKTSTYYIVSQIGMLAGACVYVNAGTQLGQIESLKGIVSPGLLISFTLLGVFPLIAKHLLAYFKGRRECACYIKTNSKE